MDKVIVNNFIAWKDAFIAHFFNNEVEGEVLLYITPEIIDNIGEKNNLGNHEDFLKSVLLCKEQRMELFKYIYESDLLYKFKIDYLSKDKSLFDSDSIIEFACLFAKKDYTCYDFAAGSDAIFKQGYFINYIVLLMYIACNPQINTEGTKGNAIGKSIREFLKKNLKEKKGEYSGTECLFQALHDLYPRLFNNGNFVKWPYVGLLKYQLFFSNRQVNEFYAALYRCNKDLDDMTFDEKINCILDYIDDAWKEILKTTRTETTHRSRIESLIASFDRDEYEAKHKDKDDFVENGLFALALIPERCEVVLLSNLQKNGMEYECKNHTYYFSGNNSDKYTEEYYCGHVWVDNSPTVKVDQYKVDLDKLKIKPIHSAKEPVIYFPKAKYSKSYYVQAKQPVVGEPCFALVKQTRESILSDDFTQVSIDEKVLNSTFGKGWLLYYCDKYTGEDIPAGEDNTTAKSEIVFCQNLIYGKKVSLVNALPYYRFPYSIEECIDEIEVNISADGTLLEKGDDYELYVIDDKLIIDIVSNYKLDFANGAIRIDSDVEYNGMKCFREFWVCSQNVEYENTQLYRYDKWGNSCDENNSNRVEGAIVIGQNHQLPEKAFNLAGLSSIYEIPKETYLVNIVAATCFMSPDLTITDSGLKKWIKYACTRKNVELSNETYKRVKSLLVNNGFLNPLYGGNPTRFQAIPPTIMKIPYFNAGGNLYMLTGCYTRKFISDLIDFCKRHYVKVYVKDRGNSDSETERLLPPIFILQSTFNVTEFKDQVSHKFRYLEDSDLATDLLSFSASVKDYQQTLSKDDIGRLRLSPADVESFPRVRIYSSDWFKSLFWIQESENCYYKSTVPGKVWMDLYCKARKGEKLFFLTQDGNDGVVHIHIPLDVYLPMLIHRALFIMNLGLPRFERAFVCGSDRDRLFTQMKVYDIRHTSMKEIESMLNRIFALGDNSVVRRCVIEQYATVELLEKNGSTWGGRYHLHLKRNSDNSSMAFSSGSKLYVKHQRDFTAVSGNINECISKILQSSKNYECLGFKYNDSDTAQIPENIKKTEKLVILK